MQLYHATCAIHMDAVTTGSDAYFTCCAVEEAVIALVRIYQSFTLSTSHNKEEHLELVQAVTMSPKGGMPMQVIARHPEHQLDQSLQHAVGQ